MTQLEKARKGKITKEMKRVAREEGFPAGKILNWVKNGSLVIPANKAHLKLGLKPLGIGEMLRTKVNVNLGTSPLDYDIKKELRKLDVSLKYGADAVMDLSNYGDIDKNRAKIIKNCPVPVGTVPVYQTGSFDDIENLSVDDFLKVVERHCRSGVDFVTVHSGITRKVLPYSKKRLTGIVSKGGTLMARWMLANKSENPYAEYFDELCEIVRKYDTAFSLGDALRPGSIHDATDKAQIEELKVVSKQAERSRELGVQVMIEGPGHIPLHEIKKNMDLKKKYAGNTPFYVLGPLVADIAPGYDHITAAIGGTLAAYYGAAFLCYVTPSEHLSLPDEKDVREGVIASRIAAHAADLALGKKGAREWNDRMSKARFELDWPKMFNQAIDREKACDYRKRSGYNKKKGECTMCGEYCPMKGMKDLREKM